MSARANPTVFSRLLAKAMDARPELLQEDLAKAIGASQGTLSNYMSGASFPDWAKAKLLGELLDIDPVDLKEAWDKVNTQREKEQKERRTKSRVSRKKKEFAQERQREKVEQLLEALMGDKAIKDLGPAAKARIRRLFKKYHPEIHIESERRKGKGGNNDQY